MELSKAGIDKIIETVAEKGIWTGVLSVKDVDALEERGMNVHVLPKQTGVFRRCSVTKSKVCL